MHNRRREESNNNRDECTNSKLSLQVYRYIGQIAFKKRVQLAQMDRCPTHLGASVPQSEIPYAYDTELTERASFAFRHYKRAKGDAYDCYCL